jgi:hypothetical protein
MLHAGQCSLEVRVPSVETVADNMCTQNGQLTVEALNSIAAV